MYRLRFEFFNIQTGLPQTERIELQGKFFQSVEEFASAMERFYATTAPHLELVSLKQVCQFERDMD